MLDTQLKTTKYIWNRFLGEYAYKHRQIKARNRPEVFAIEVTNYCNLDCVMCPRREMKRKVGMMSFDLFKEIIDQIRDYNRHVLLHNFGEPLFHPQIDKMIDYCAENRIKTKFSTNGTILDREHTLKILNSRLDGIILSLDGSTRETYEKLRVKGEYEQVEQNIVNFLKLKREMHLKKLHTIIQIIHMNETETEIIDFIKRWKPYVDEVLIKPYSTWADQVEGIKELSKPEHRFKPKIKRRYPCLWPWVTVVIQWNGDVVPCCYDYDSKYILGNVKEKSLVEIWNGEEVLNLRRQFVEGNYNNPLCKQCIDWPGEPAEKLYPLSISPLRKMVRFLRER